MILRYVIIVAAALTLQGCWFVFIPGSLISGAADAMSGNQGQNCVGETARVGDRIRLNDGRIGTVQKLEGTSSRCTDSRWPIRALLTFD